jgi:hypothetical protein
LSVVITAVRRGARDVADAALGPDDGRRAGGGLEPDRVIDLDLALIGRANSTPRFDDAKTAFIEIRPR